MGPEATQGSPHALLTLLRPSNAASWGPRSAPLPPPAPPRLRPARRELAFVFSPKSLSQELLIYAGIPSPRSPGDAGGRGRRKKKARHGSRIPAELGKLAADPKGWEEKKKIKKKGIFQPQTPESREPSRQPASLASPAAGEAPGWASSTPNFGEPEGSTATRGYANSLRGFAFSVLPGHEHAPGPERPARGEATGLGYRREQRSWWETGGKKGTNGSRTPSSFLPRA